MARDSEQVQALINKASTQVKNGKDAAKSTAELVKELRGSGSAVLDEFADRLEGK